MSSLLSFSSILSYVGYVVMAIIVLLFMVLIHELGHYTAGKILKFKINEFSIGFGPKIFQKKKKNGELVSLRVLPLGGYCAFDGEDETGKESPTAFNNQKPWKRLIVLFCGAFFNFLSGIIFAFILLVSCGYDLVQVKQVDQTSINYQALQQNDVILGVNGNKIDFVKDDYINPLITDYVENNYNKYKGENLTEEKAFVNENKTYYIVLEELPLNIKRDGKKCDQTAYINVIYNEKGECSGWTLLHDYTDNPEEFSMRTYRYSFGEAVLESVPYACKWGWKILVTFTKLLTGRPIIEGQSNIKSIGGPITTINMIASSTAEIGFTYVLILLPALAVNLAVFNLLPIPALDGFQMLFVLIEWIRKKPVKREVVNAINNVGLIVLLGFVVVIEVMQFIL